MGMSVPQRGHWPCLPDADCGTTKRCRQRGQWRRIRFGVERPVSAAAEVSGGLASVAGVVDRGIGAAFGSVTGRRKPLVGEGIPWAGAGGCGATWPSGGLSEGGWIGLARIDWLGICTLVPHSGHFPFRSA